jgi:SAM-dependent methyltransferase
VSASLKICSVCGFSAESFDPGPDGRLDAACPSCGSLERHRLLVQLIDLLVPAVLRAGAIVEIAPNKFISRELRRFGSVVRVDLDPRSRRVDLVSDLSRLSLGSATADVIVCYHVLEHVDDDFAAIREIARVLTPGGVAIIQVPIRRGLATDEDISATPAERVRRFGQEDHVRWYGDDFEDRLQECGLRYKLVNANDLIDPRMRQALRLTEGEEVWLCSRSDSDEPEVLCHLDGRWTETYVRLTEVLARSSHRDRRRAGRVDKRNSELMAEVKRLRKSRGRWKQRYKSLRSRRSVRLALRVSGGGRG